MGTNNVRCECVPGGCCLFTCHPTTSAFSDAWLRQLWSTTVGLGRYCYNVQWMGWMICAVHIFRMQWPTAFELYYQGLFTTIWPACWAINPQHKPNTFDAGTTTIIHNSTSILTTVRWHSSCVCNTQPNRGDRIAPIIIPPSPKRTQNVRHWLSQIELYVLVIVCQSHCSHTPQTIQVSIVGIWQSLYFECALLFSTEEIIGFGQNQSLVWTF